MTLIFKVPSINGNVLRVSLVLMVAFVLLMGLGLLSSFLLSQAFLTPAFLTPDDDQVPNPTVPAGADAADAEEYVRLVQQFWRFERARDFPNATPILQRCTQIETSRWHRGAFCEIRYARAVLRGEGVDRDEAEALRLFAEVERTNAGDRVADLAGLYESAVGVSGDRVLASVFAWHADHDPYFGLCKERECGGPDLSDLIARIDSRLTGPERDLAREIEQKKYPRTVRQYELFYAINTLIFTLVALIFGAICWGVLRSARKQHTPGSPGARH
jgi:hypothetical protein